MQPRSLKLTIKLKSEKSVDNPSTAADHPSNVEGQPCASNDTNPEDQNDPNSKEVLENPSMKDEENPSENSQFQLVLYDPSVNGAGETNPVPVNHQPPSFARQHPRVLPAIGVFTVQCANCLKWRLIPTQEKYEEIREHIIDQPFVCKTSQEWRPNISCDDPPDITQDRSRLWAIDKPNIAQPPPGWQRLLKFRGQGSSKFADVYYVSPSGKRLRSMVEVQKYLTEHPEYVEQGVELSRFSFQIPRPLQDNYVRKRPARAAPTNDLSNHGMLPHPSEVQPISWVRPDVDTDLQLSGPGHLPYYTGSPSSGVEPRPPKKKKRPSEGRYSGNGNRNGNGNVVHNQNEANLEEPQL